MAVTDSPTDSPALYSPLNLHFLTRVSALELQKLAEHLCCDSQSGAEVGVPRGMALCGSAYDWAIQHEGGSDAPLYLSLFRATVQPLIRFACLFCFCGRDIDDQISAIVDLGRGVPG